MDRNCNPSDKCPYYPVCEQEETSKYRPLWQIARMGAKALGFANGNTEKICRRKLDELDMAQYSNMPTAEEVETWYRQQQELDALRNSGL